MPDAAAASVVGAGYGEEVTGDLDCIDEQLRRLRFEAFDEETAWQLGCDLQRRAAELEVAVTVEVRLAGSTVFLHAMRGTAPANADWARRKRNVVELLHRPSYAVGLEAERSGRSVLADMGLDDREVAAHGGAFPVIVVGIGVVGVATVSGLPQRHDHELVVEALAELCGADLTGARLA